MKRVLLITQMCWATLLMAQQNDISILEFQDQVRVNTADLKEAELIYAETNCNGSVDISFEDKKFSGGCAGVIERTYQLKDECGNSLEKIQYITLEDNTPPVFSNPPEPEVWIESRLDYSKPVDLFAVDETGEYAEVTLEETFDTSNPELVQAIRIWTAKDACDNTSTVQQIVKMRIPAAEDTDR